MSTARQPAPTIFSVLRSARGGAAALAALVGLSAAALLWSASAAVAQVSFSGPTNFPVGNRASVGGGR